jgi:hypothetical protein
MESYVDVDHSHVLDHDGSPIGGAMSLLFNLVWKSAKQRGGDAAFRPDPDPEEQGDQILQQPWYDAAAALIDAAVAEGAPHLLRDNEADILCQAWRQSGLLDRAGIPFGSWNRIDE